jgi:hypothetical protein
MYYPNKTMLHERYFDGFMAAAQVHARMHHSIEDRARAIEMAHRHGEKLARLEMQAMSERAAQPAPELENA